MDNTPVKRGRGRPPKTAEEKHQSMLEYEARKRERHRNGELTDYGQEHVEPGDNSRYIRHALATLNLPPIDIADPQQVSDRIDWYFHHCADNEMKPTVTGFCNALGVHKDTIRTWYNGEARAGTHQDIIRRAYRVLEELWEDYMLNGKINPVSGIFLGKNQWVGYNDKQELVLTPNNNGIPEPQDIKAIEEKYAELPED